MINSVKHIGICVKEIDIENFYKKIFNGSVEKTFELKEEQAYSIFRIKKQIKIMQLICEGVSFELFIHDNHSDQGFTHTCILSERAVEIAEKSRDMGYDVYSHNNHPPETFFIKDSNFNLFEIKAAENV
ncbi:MAG: hypothetical protein A2275_12955 [Bacteroidetes bacterium RIFOXYA12_FULL_35_11]|nr:MAG: hypothetical protein A2X01_05805 [Bacteroidetes bacterium GWF2_35_48]OFY72618.1 MAG: hypothetical protein A2275_12955 [Bacteroidetes bacterium RIFOXYA12_FULL_35_11]OFY93357.1 MAG: hypothetical protein A2491_06425 [Bacteroidetes bacterium RIFOXYC12_FULL_35_7]HBX52526.1 hypothetical protein [Bacteroidales bacterium]